MSFVDPPLAEVGDWPPPAPANAADLIALASERVRAHCGWQISERVDDDHGALDYDGRGLVLGADPAPAPTSPSSAADGVPRRPGSMFDWYENGLIRLRWRAVPAGPRRFTATVTHGYDPVPMAVSAAAITVARDLDSNPFGRQLGPRRRRVGHLRRPATSVRAGRPHLRRRRPGPLPDPGGRMSLTFGSFWCCYAVVACVVLATLVIWPHPTPANSAHLTGLGILVAGAGLIARWTAR